MGSAYVGGVDGLPVWAEHPRLSKMPEVLGQAPRNYPKSTPPPSLAHHPG